MRGEGPPSGHIPTVPEILVVITNMKRLGLASLTFLLYDMILTLPAEMKYIWGTRWTFARIAFHANRVLGVLGTVMLVTVSFTTDLSERVHVGLPSLRITVFAQTQISELVVPGSCSSTFSSHSRAAPLLQVKHSNHARLGDVRCKALAHKNVVFPLSPASDSLFGPAFYSDIIGTPCVVVPSSVANLSHKDDNILPNRAPGLITGCRFKPLIYFNMSYITSFIFETTVFGMTVYKTWKISRTPLMTRLARDGSYYYFFVFATLLSMAASYAYPPATCLVSGSGIFMAAMSSMCSRMILSGLSYNDSVLIIAPPAEMQSGPLPYASMGSDEQPEPTTPSFAIQSSRRV
ncbi:hypothetical protein FRC07_010552, partial [Ceratobasidium sp. 392]